MCEVATIHLQQPDPTITYFTGTARRPDDTAVAYIGVFALNSYEMSQGFQAVRGELPPAGLHGS